MHLPKEAAWVAEYLHELTVFPKGKHDDQLDLRPRCSTGSSVAARSHRTWMWQQYKRAQARGPQPARPEPLSVMAKRLGILREM